MHQNLSPSQQQFLDQHRNPIQDATVTTTNDSLSVALSHDRIIEETYKEDRVAIKNIDSTYACVIIQVQLLAMVRGFNVTRISRDVLWGGDSHPQ